jgi:hypothetical protein
LIFRTPACMSCSIGRRPQLLCPARKHRAMRGRISPHLSALLLRLQTLAAIPQRSSCVAAVAVAAMVARGARVRFGLCRRVCELWARDGFGFGCELCLLLGARLIWTKMVVSLQEGTLGAGSMQVRWTRWFGSLSS